MMSHAVAVNRKTRVISLLFCCMVLLLMLSPAVFNVSAATASTDASGSRIIVSLGDSYSSGEGIEPFYGQNDPIAERVRNQDWLAHRSEKSWSGRLILDGVSGTMAKNRGTNWFFVATSGATTDDLNAKQRKEYDIDGFSDDDYIDKQLDVFNKLGDKKAEYVTLTMGGNDADFVGVVTEAAIPHPFNPGALNDKLNAVWNEFYYGVDGEAGIREKLRQAYYDIQATAGMQAKILVAGYPKLFDPDGSGFLFSENDATLINDSVSRFNDEIESIVKSCKADGMKICFVSVEEAFEGHGAYSDDAFIHKVYITRQDQDLKGGISAYSMHPNDEGAQIYADCVQAKIDEIEKDGGKTEWPTMTGSDERDIALVLDVSGSMAGTPMDETKKASDKFVNTILKEDASIGMVTYDSSSMRLSDFCMNERYLNNIIQNLNSGGGTNMEAGLTQAYEMLQDSSAKKKIIVLMSDGEPNEGKVGQELVEYAEKIKEDGIYIYTLGFFGSMGYGKSSAQILMEEIASDGCHYEVDDADNLVYFFGDIADQINGQKYIYVRIACPVDVTVTYDGETLCSEEDDLSTRTDFGSLTFEENEEEAIDGSDNRVKILRLKEGAEYDIKIDGTDRGEMDYTIGFMDEAGEYSDLREFKNIKITRKTVIDTVASNTDSTVLKVDEDGDGRYDLTYKAKADSRGELVDYTYIIYIVVGAVVLIAALVIVIVLKKRSKNKKSKI